MARKAAAALLATAILAGASLAPSAQAATPKPAWDIHSLATPTVFKPGETSGLDRYEVVLTNIGAEVSDGSPIQIADTLPAGLGVKQVELLLIQQGHGLPIDFGPAACETQTVGEVSTVSCEISEALPGAVEQAKVFPSAEVLLVVKLEVPPSASGSLTNSVTVKGGGAGEAAATSHNEAGEGEAPAGLQHFGAALTGSDGKPATGADSHPYEQTTSFALNTALTPPGSDFPFLPAEGDLKDIEVALPPGLVGNPTATDRCTAQQFNAAQTFALEGEVAFKNECPDASAVGLAIVQQLEGEAVILPAPIYNLVPPKEMPAQLGFEILGFPIYIDTKLRSDSDYGITAYLQNTTEAKRVTAASVTIWGVPGEESHDPQRGHCLAFAFGFSIGNCPSGIPVKPFLRLPSSCQSPLETTMRFDTWLHPGAFQEALFEEPAPTDCDLPDFSPSIEAKPTTDVADAPSGLHFDLHLPQAANEDPAGLGEADIREAKVTLPEGLLPNPAFATGREACSAAQIGLTSPLGQSPAQFSADPPACPDASKLGAVAVDTPLIDHPLPGAVYLAMPHENPFDSLLAIYIAVSDPQTGVVVKLAGQVEPDPVTGQLTTTVKESPQTPFEDFKLDFFEGARAPLRTPATCGTHTTATDLKPWTSPAFGPDATPSDSFQITTGAGGGSCPTTPSGEPNSPNFEAGTAAPIAAAFSPFSLHLARQDGSQEIKGINLDLPPGLTGKLAGLSYCPDGALASAASKSGKAEQGSPSCPASSQLGTVTVGAGAGPAPFYAQGKAYLAGPYKGAPISMAILTPAVAGPFDLGTVVVRAALNVDPETARIHAVSDPIPTILQGIPLDVSEHRAARRPQPVHPQPDLLRPLRLLRAGSIGPGPERNSDPALPGRRLLFARLQAEALPEAQGRHQTGRSPGSHRDPDDAPGRRQHRLGPGRPAPQRVPRPGPHPHDLHPRPVRRKRLPQRRDLRLCQGDHALARQTARRPGLPALLLPQAARRSRRPERPDPHRLGRPRRLGPRRYTQHLRSHPRRPCLQSPLQPQRRQEGPLDQQPRDLRRGAQGHGRLHCPEREGERFPPGGRGKVQRQRQEEQQAPPLGSEAKRSPRSGPVEARHRVRGGPLD